ncbi:hypothetical protein M885DRAFT_537250 [Pelagophyceae sp. CCMP2097]|nr:hypothetical protein M885DRAFT_537250 [Pelagophyceae sp. CCMP2097]
MAPFEGAADARARRISSRSARPSSAPPLRIVTHALRRMRPAARVVAHDDATYFRPRSSTRPPRPLWAPAVAAKPDAWADVDAVTAADMAAPVRALSEGKKRDYGYGVPKWSPYWNPPNHRLPPRTLESKVYGDFRASALSPALQMRAARAGIKEMKGRATVDHCWELVGHRPDGIDDLAWIEVSRIQTDLEIDELRAKHLTAFD